jgi:cystathionine gamma-synthase
MSDLKPQSWVVAAGRPEAAGSPLNVPLVPASNYLRGEDKVYTRDSGAPGWEALEEIVGGLEGGRAVSFSSGMAAAAAVFDQLPVGARIAIPDDCYHGVAELARLGQDKGQWQVIRIAVTDMVHWVTAAREADLLWLESPSNPLLQVADLKAICSAPRKEGSILVVDNTFATPLNQKPLELGADISMHSATKFIGGHSDLLSGILVCADDALYGKLLQSRTVNGATPGALEAFLAVRGIRTLALRLEKAEANAARLAEWLDGHSAVGVVRYPGLSRDSSYCLASAQLEGYGCIISFDVDGTVEQADAVCDGVGLVRHATSLGSVESTMERRAAIAGQDHLPPTLLRLSVGIEAFEDLRDDLDQAFAKAGLL